MAQAVKRLHPGVKLAIGPAIEDGFYYDFAKPEPFTPEDLAKIDEVMREIAKADYPFQRQEMTRADAVRFFREHGEPYKVEILEGLDAPRVSLYRQGEFVDLCRGPHIPHAGKVGAFKLLSIAGAYWKGHTDQMMLQRVYGTAFFDKKELDAYLSQVEEAKKRDHRKLGKELGLFTISPLVGSGLILWMPKGAIVRSVLESFLKDVLLKRGYQPVYTPHIGRIEL